MVLPEEPLLFRVSPEAGCTATDSFVGGYLFEPSSDCLWKILPGVSCCINTVPRDLSRRKRKSRRPLLIRHCRLLTAATVWPSSLKRNLLSAASADLSSSLDVLNLHSTWITVPSYPVMACDCS